eukprot:maker-scaffold369_size193746-snap-gene-0.37 protein:Tk07572 transcript:maker-scaffold369_size193746-snap-gene-0.37-mRNA-1 annotation:"PREDICTED: uncharacterized protein LOC102666182"
MARMYLNWWFLIFLSISVLGERNRRSVICTSVIECMSIVGRSISFRYVSDINQIVTRFVVGDDKEREREAEVKALRAKLEENRQISELQVDMELFKQGILGAKIQSLRGDSYSLRTIPIFSPVRSHGKKHGKQHQHR